MTNAGVDMGILLSLSKSTTSTLLGISESVVFVFGIILIIGLFGEKKTPWWKLKYDVFLTMVALGCFGELVGDTGVFLFSSHLQEISDEQLTQAQLNIADALLQADSAKSTAELFGMVAAEAKERAFRNEKEARQLAKIAEEERIARLKLEERMAWRRITPKQHDEFVKVLLPYAGSVVELNQTLEPEAATFANDIRKILQDSHWRVLLHTSGQIVAVAIGPNGNMTSEAYGLRCAVDQASPAGKALFSVFSQLGDVKFEPMAPASKNIASILVGLKPPP